MTLHHTPRSEQVWIVMEHHSYLHQLLYLQKAAVISSTCFICCPLPLISESEHSIFSFLRPKTWTSSADERGDRTRRVFLHCFLKFMLGTRVPQVSINKIASTDKRHQCGLLLGEGNASPFPPKVTLVAMVVLLDGAVAIWHHCHQRIYQLQDWAAYL